MFKDFVLILKSRSQISKVATEEEQLKRFRQESKLNVKKIISKMFLFLMASTISSCSFLMKTQFLPVFVMNDLVFS